jgi:hypothetical protein
MVNGECWIRYINPVIPFKHEAFELIIELLRSS